MPASIKNEIKVLSIDDSKAVHAFLDFCLKDSNVKVEHAMSGPEGLSKLKDSNGVFSAVLLDWEMPEMTGPEVLTKIREAGYQLPVIMLTSKNDINEISEVLSRGASEYIMKPFTTEILMGKINTVLELEV